jgi:hypothetical protein
VPQVPTECQSLADQVAALEQQYTALAGQVSSRVGPDAWSGLAQLGALHLQLTDARRELDVCVRTHSAALTGNIVVMDASGGAPAGQQVATLWDLTGGGPVSRETAVVQGGSFGFQGPLPASHAITLSTTGVPAVTGADFRSGALQAPAAAPQQRFELVVAPVFTITQDDLDAWSSAFQPVTQSVMMTLTTTVAAARATLGQNTVTIAVSGTVGGSIMNLSVPQTAFSASVSVGLFPSTDPSAVQLVDVALAGANPVQVELSGSFLGAAVNQVSALIVPQLGSFFQGAVADWAHQQIPAVVTDMLRLAQLPAGTTLTLRSVSIAGDGLRFQPVLGAIGTGLSTFQPQAIPPA